MLVPVLRAGELLCRKNMDGVIGAALEAGAAAYCGSATMPCGPTFGAVIMVAFGAYISL